MIYTRTYNSFMRTVTASIVCMLSFIVAVYAQNNPFKIDDRLYPLYLRANNSRSLVLADSLFSEATKLNDKKAQCLALVVAVRHHYSGKDSLPMTLAVDRLKAFSKKTGYEQYYYFACINYINFLMRKTHFNSAFEYAQRTYQEAVASNSIYGIFTCQKALANIHASRNEYRQALKLYQEALDYANRHLGKEDMAFLYFRIASCLLNQDDYDKTLKYADMCINTSQVPLTILRARYLLAMAYFYKNEKQKFIETYEITSKDYLKYDKDSTSSSKWGLDVMYFITIGDFDKAIEAANAHPSTKQRLYFLALAYERNGDYYNALKTQYQHSSFNDSIASIFSSQNLASQTSSLSNFLLNEDKRQIELDNISLELSNSQLALETSRNNAESARLNAENTRFEYENNILEANRMNEQLKKQKIEQQQADISARNKNNAIISSLLIGSASIVIIVIIIIWYNNVSHKLKETNKTLQRRKAELNVARNKAVEADKMQTMFLQNMSHEVRTPLNAIVGFSQLLAEDADSLEAEERSDFSRRIEKNSELILNIVNDILDITSIESGHYSMKHKDTNINKICRQAIDAVMHDTADGVKLEFSTDIADDFSITSDPMRIAQIIRNLLSNAQKNTSTGSIRLDCSASRKDGYISISVTDTGIGIEPKHRELIFERFYKVDDLKQGAGLGLSVSHSVALMLGGNLYLDTSYSGGARFILEIPTTPHTQST